MNNFFDHLTLGGVIMIILIAVFLFDKTHHNQIRGKETTDEEDAREKNPFIPKYEPPKK